MFYIETASHVPVDVLKRELFNKCNYLLKDQQLLAELLVIL